MSEKRLGIIDAVLICNQCGQKIRAKHLKCQKEKREKLISEFVKEKKEVEKDLRRKWKRLGKWVHIEKKNHIRSVNDTYQGYLMAIHIWKMYRVDYYSKRSGRRN